MLPGPTALTLRRLRRDRAALAFGTLLVLAFLAAPLYASWIAGTTPTENHLSDQVTVGGERRDVVSLEGVPIGPTWRPDYFLGADGNGRDLMVRVLYGGRTTLLVGLLALAISLTLAIPLALAAGYFRGVADQVVSRLLDLVWSFPVLLVGLLLVSSLSLRGVQVGPVTIAAESPSAEA
jgi:peptide/nickel transport system permease protein